MESSHILLDCGDFIKNPELAAEGSFGWPDMDENSSLRWPLRNGTFYGFNTTRKSKSSWAIALDRFVDQDRIDLLNREERPKKTSRERRPFQTPAIFENETDIKIGPTKLYFEARTTQESNNHGANIACFCNVTQQYVESQATCLSTPYTQGSHCKVTKIRLSQLPHAPESISHLSFPSVFYYVSRYLPLASVVGTASESIALKYLNNTFMQFWLDSQENWFEHTLEFSFSAQLNQLINTYLLIGQMGTRVAGGSQDHLDVPAGSRTTNLSTSELIEVYSVSSVWTALMFASSLVLLAGGIAGVVIKHLASRPEVLGYASTIIRKSRYINVPSELDRMSGIYITKEMKEVRVKYGSIRQEGKVPVSFGVARQENVNLTIYW